jgi:putative endonuclease
MLSLSKHVRIFKGKKSEMFWVYILRCSDGSYYTGHTDNLEKRFHEHQSGTRTGYTSTRKPVELAYNQTFSTREEEVNT